MKRTLTKKSVIDIPLSRISKPTADISFKRTQTNLVTLIVRRTNEYISLSLTDEEVIALKNALKSYFGY